MDGSDKNNLNEDLSKSDISKEVKIYIDSASFKAKIEKIVKDRLKNDKELEDKVVEISSNVLTQLYKTLWIKRSFWKNNLSNKSN
jgi:tryptophanyl-tRNA synthetase